MTITSHRRVYIIAVAFIIALILRVFVIEVFIVRGDSMSPEVESGDYVFVNKLAYLGGKPDKGDVIVAVPREYKKKVIKRVEGLPGEQIESNGETVNLDPGEYFLLGDNREVSLDSEELGLIDEWDIKGKVIGIFRIRNFILKSI